MAVQGDSLVRETQVVMVWHTYVGYELLHFWICSNANKQHIFSFIYNVSNPSSEHKNKKRQLAPSCPRPQDKDKSTKDQRTHWINPPSQLTSTDTSQQAETIDKQIITVILPQDLNLLNNFSIRV